MLNLRKLPLIAIRLIVKLIKNIVKRAIRILTLVSVGLLLIAGFHAIPITYEATVNEIMPTQSLNLYALQGVLVFLADGNDIVNIHIESPGGSVRMANNLINDVQNSDATVNMQVEGFAASAAANLMMTGDTLSVHPDSTIVFHRPYVQLDASRKIVTADEKGIARVDDLVMNRIMPILLDQEKADYIAGKDIWIKGNVLIFRLQLAKMTGHWPMLPSPVRIMPLT